MEDGLTCEPDETKGLDIFVDEDLAGGFDEANAEDPELMHSRNGFIVKHTVFPIVWK